MTQPGTNLPIDSIWEYIYSRAEHMVRIAESDELPGFYELMDSLVTDIVATYPGAGKTREGTRLANELWERWKLPTLYLMLGHSMIEEQLGRMTPETQSNWAHWQRHSADCRRTGFNEAWYFGHGQCDCGRGPLEATSPTFAPVEYALPNLPDRGQPLAPSGNEFFLWIIDEIDFRRLLGKLTVERHDVQRASQAHQDPAIRTFCDVLASMMSRQRGFRLEGGALYSEFTRAATDQGHDISQLTRELGESRPTMRPWTNQDDDQLPPNFPPALLPVFLDELNSFGHGWHITPRIHLVGAGQRAELRIWWRKELDYRPDSGPKPPPAIILDATADPGLLREVFEVTSTVATERPDWPSHVHVHQWSDNLVTRSTLGMPYNGNHQSPKNIAARQRWYARICEALSDFPHNWPVGIITHREIEAEAAAAIADAGFSDVRSLHYGADRGSNYLEGRKALVLLGLPIPNVQDFQEEAQAFLYFRNQPLQFAWEPRERFLEMRDDPPHSVNVEGYWAEPVASYYQQKCQAGLYQSVHRLRPYLVAPDDERHIFIFTNMPVKDVVVDELLRDPARVAEEQRIAARVEIVLSELTSQLEQFDECTVPNLARIVAPHDDQSEATVRHWITENAANLAESTGSDFEPGKTGRAGRFRRPA